MLFGKLGTTRMALYRRAIHVEAIESEAVVFVGTKYKVVNGVLGAAD